MSGLTEVQKRAARSFTKFVNEACTPFHAVKLIKTKLDHAGFVHLPEGSNWNFIKPGGKYYVVRNETSVVAFVLGGKFNPEKGLKIVGAHTDSPNFNLKPKTQVKKSSDYHQVAVQCYGGGLWHTWFDRDLTVAGRVIVQSDKLEGKLVHIRKPILRIPNLAIHLCSQEERQSFGPNKESHMVPIISSAKMAKENNASEAVQSQCGPLMQTLAAELQCQPEEIVDFDLSVVDTQDACLGGLYDEFIFSPRIDNLVSCFCAIEALLTDDKSVENDEMARMVCLFDHEEVGSSSPSGAGGTLLPDLIERLVGNSMRSILVANSFLLSVDGAHGVHPNYPDKHESCHRPLLNEGPVIKYNANVRYATNGLTGAIVCDLAKKVAVPIQKFVVKNDSPCGSTIGPILSTLSGIKTADIGNAQLSMHSVREMCGTADIFYMTELIKSFFSNYKNPEI
eukprot:gene2317-1453_t